MDANWCHNNYVIYVDLKHFQSIFSPAVIATENLHSHTS